MSKEEVNHPPHYKGLSQEVIDIIEEFGLDFHLGNVIKYVLRANAKGNRETDLKKAAWYIERAIRHPPEKIKKLIENDTEDEMSLRTKSINDILASMINEFLDTGE